MRVCHRAASRPGSVVVNVEHLTGYAHPDYGRSLEEFGEPRWLPQSGATILCRQVPGATDRDAMGCYPLLVCADWAMLKTDLDALSDELLCVSAVTDPFGDYDLEMLQQAFKTIVRPFKPHYVIDLGCCPETYISRHHRRNVQKASRLLTVERCENVDRFLPDWLGLYANLVARHGIRGIAAFSARSFIRQTKVPGLVLFRAVHGSTTIGMLLWYVRDAVGYYHLGAFSEEGYALGASFALFRHAIEVFRAEGLKWLTLGGAAGVVPRADDGVSRFKEGWSTGTRMAYFCGRIFDRERYDRIVRAAAGVETGFFPAYRQLEWG
jgi:hypothetical protein